MESVFNFICLHAEDAQWLIFGLLLLAGFNFPFSEDLLLIIGGAIASTCVSHHPFETYLWLYLGCWISAWEAYWIGRSLGPKLYKISWFRSIISPSRIARMRHYFEKFGILTFIAGRFIPGGVRNALFMTSGLSRMPFGKFLMLDALACLISSATLFYLGYVFGENHTILIQAFKKYQNFFILFVVILLSSLFLLFWWLRQKPIPDHNQPVS